MSQSMPFLLSRPRRASHARRPDAGTPDAGPRARATPAPLAGGESARASVRELADDVARMAVSIEWLAQVVAGVPQESAALRTLDGYVVELTGLMDAIDRVQSRALLPTLAPAFGREAPLFAYLKTLFAWTCGLADAFEEIATGLRRREPVRPVFLLQRINASYARLDGLMHATKASLRATELDEAHARALDVDLEELSWAASWLHVSLTKRFGE
jgi:hypothetical protein